jgi:integrase/recombinase XerD
LAKQKKQSRLIGFFWACVRRDYIIKNPSMGLGRIKVVQVPTDYFPRDEFERIMDTTYVYGDPRGGYIPIEDTRTRLRALTLLMRWSGLRIRDAITSNAIACTAIASCSIRPRPERPSTSHSRLL